MEKEFPKGEVPRTDQEIMGVKGPKGDSGAPGPQGFQALLPRFPPVSL